MEILAAALSAFLGCAFPYVVNKWEDMRRHKVDLIQALDELNTEKQRLNERLQPMVVSQKIEAVESVNSWLQNVDTINNEIKRKLEAQLCSCAGLGKREAKELENRVILLRADLVRLENGDLVRLLPEGIVAVGPWGINDGCIWNYGTNVINIRKITIHAASCIDSIQIIYDNSNEPIEGEKHGGPGGHPTEIALQEGEYITEVSGRYGPVHFSEIPVLRWLRFTTSFNNITSCGTDEHGAESSTYFTLPVKGGRIVSFFGTSNTFLTSIGFHVSNV